MSSYSLRIQMFSMCGYGHREQRMHRVLERHGSRHEAELGGAHRGVFRHGLQEQLADHQMLFEMRIGPASFAHLRLLELYGATLMDARQHAPAEVDGVEDAGLGTCHATGTLVDPEAACDAGEQLG